MTFGDFRKTAGRSNDETVKILILFPQKDRKLHSCVSSVWIDPSVRYSRGMVIGDEVSSTKDLEEVKLVRYSWREEGGCWIGDVEVMDTWNNKDFQGRPPEPFEELRSNTRSSQTPNSLGTTTFTSTDHALLVVTVMLCAGENGQFAHSLKGHCAFNTPPLSLMRSPTSNEVKYKSSVFSFTHTQRPVPKLSQVEQLRVFVDESSALVRPSNPIVILVPSAENIALFINGPGSGSVDPWTTNWEPEGKEIS
jgi:hypothetical protein